MQLATTKAEEARRKISIKQPEIDSYLSNLGLPAHKKLIIRRYLNQKIEEDRSFDIFTLLYLLEEDDERETVEEWMKKLEDVKNFLRNTTKHTAESWISNNGIPNELEEKIMRNVRLRLQEVKDVSIGIENILPVLPSPLEAAVKKHLCLPMLQKVPMLQNMDEPVYETICEYLKPVTFAQSHYIIREREPLDMMLFITQGVVWTFSSTRLVEHLRKGDYYGNELIEWQFSPTSYSELPMSTANLKSHTKVEAFALMALDLKTVLFIYFPKFYQRHSNYESMPEGLKRSAVSMHQEFRRNIRKKKARKYNQPQPQPGDLSINIR